MRRLVPAAAPADSFRKGIFAIKPSGIAYEAGSVDPNGDPRLADRSMIDWIEMIPFNETRNYVQRVLENVVVYQARRNGTLPVMMSQWRS